MLVVHLIMVWECKLCALKVSLRHPPSCTSAEARWAAQKPFRRQCGMATDAACSVDMLCALCRFREEGKFYDGSPQHNHGIETTRM